jgi:hypothetical protein
MVTAILIYLSIGSVIWLILDGTGVIDNTYAARNRSAGRAMVFATIMMIVCWPLFVARWLKGMLA